MSVFDWIEMARALDADGLEMFDAFFESLEPAYLDRVGAAIHTAGFQMPMPEAGRHHGHRNNRHPAPVRV